jgi:ankyrin repeat protein
MNDVAWEEIVENYKNNFDKLPNKYLHMKINGIYLYHWLIINTKYYDNLIDLFNYHTNKGFNHADSFQNWPIQNEKKLDINLKNKHGQTALMLASMYSNTMSNNKIVQLLIDIGCNINIQDKKKNTALMLAAKYSHSTSTFDTVKLLINTGALLNIQSKNGHTALIEAITYSNTTSNIETIKLLIYAGADINLPIINNWTPLMIAIYYSNTTCNIETVKLLIDVGSLLNLQNNNGNTALIIACSMEKINFNVVKYLINSSVDINMINNSGYKFLDYLNNIQKKTYIRIFQDISLDLNKLREKYESSNCPICLDDIDQDGVFTKCGHNFHINCYKDYYDRAINKTCPLCIQDL